MSTASTDPTLTFVSGTASSVKFRFVNPNPTMAKTFFLEYTTESGQNTSTRIPLVASDASGDILPITGLDSSKAYLFQLTQTGVDIAGVYQRFSDIYKYSPVGPPSAPKINVEYSRVTDGGCELNITPGATNGGKNIKYAFHSQNTSNVDVPPIKHWTLVDASSSGVITLANGNLYYPFTDLSNGNVYEFWVNAINDLGECSEDSNTMVVTPTNCPSYVVNLAATVGDASALIKWEPPVDISNAPYTRQTDVNAYTLVVNDNLTKQDISIRTFKIDASNAFPDLSLNTVGVVSTYSFKVTQLKNFQNYTVTVYASSKNGDGLQRNIQVLPYSSDLDINSTVKAYPGNQRIDVSWNTPLSSSFPINKYTADIYSATETITALGTKVTLTKVGSTQNITYDPSSNGATAGFSSLTNGTLYKIVVTVVLENPSDKSLVVCTVDEKTSGIFSKPFTTSGPVTSYAFNPYPSLAILDWNEPSNTGGYPIVRYDISYVDLSGIVQNFSTKDSTITITGLANGTNYGVNISPVTGPVLTYNNTNVVKSTFVSGTVKSDGSFNAVASFNNLVANTVNNLSYKYVDASNITLQWKRPTPLLSGDTVAGSTQSVVSYAIYATNEQGYYSGNAVATVYDLSDNKFDLSQNITVNVNSTGYYGVRMTVLYKYTAGTVQQQNIVSNIQYIPYSVGQAPSISSIDISNVIIPKSSNNPSQYTEGTVTINITNNNELPTGVICFAPDIKGDSINGATQTASSLATANAKIVATSLTTSQVVFVYKYAVAVTLVTASNKYGASYLTKP